MARKLSRQGERALDAANAMMERAWSEKDPAERHALAARALALSPLCTDAHLLFAEEAEANLPEAITHFRRAVSVGAAAVGPAGFRAMAATGERTDRADAYIEALTGLAHALWDSGAREEAVITMARVLTVDPRDEEGVRYRLVGWLLEEDCDEEAAIAMAGGLGDEGSGWSWAAALMEFRASGADEGARSLLLDAVTADREVARRLLGPDRAPGSLQDEVDEAVVIDALLVTGALEEAWFTTNGAVDWLAAELPGLLAAIGKEEDEAPDRLA